MNPTLRNALSMESDEVTLEADEAKVETEVEEATTEIVESGAEVEKAEVEQEELERAEASMEKIYLALEGAGENGLSQESASAYSLAAEIVLGGALPNPVSMEGYDEDPSGATQLSMESVKGVIAKIWKAIKTAVAKSIKAIGDFLKSLFSGVDKLGKRIDSQLATVAKLKKDGAKAKEDKLKISGADKLAYKGKFDASAFVSGAKEVEGSIVKSMLDLTIKTNAYYKSLVDAFKAKASEAGKAADDLVKEEKEIVDDLQKMRQELPGGKEAIVSLDNDTGVLASFELTDSKSAYKGDGEIDTPSLDQVEDVLKSLKDIVGKVSTKKKEIEMSNRLRDDALKAADKWAKDVEKEGEGKVDQKEVKKLLKRANSKLTGATSKLAKYLFNYARAASGAVKEVTANYAAE